MYMYSKQEALIQEELPVKSSRFDEVLPELLGAVPLCLIPSLDELVLIVFTLL